MEFKKLNLSEAAELMKQWKEEQKAFFSHLGITPSGYVMTADNGQPMHPDSPTDWLAKFAKRHGLPPIHPHKFRHTQASLLISEGVDILTVSKRLGHAKVSTTLDIYSHVLAKSDQQASDKLDTLLFEKNEYNTKSTISPLLNFFSCLAFLPFLRRRIFMV